MNYKLIITALLGLTVSSARAAGNIKLGPVSVTPMLQTEERYDNNIYLTKTKAIDSWINQTGVGSDFSVTMHERSKLALGYQADFLSYIEAPKANDAIHQTGDLLFGYQAPSGWNLNVSEKFMDTTDPAASELVTRTRRTQNDASVSVDRQVEGGLGLGVDFQHTLHDYSSDTLSAQLDRQEYRGDVKVLYPIGATTKGIVGYRFTRVVYTDSLTNKKNSKGHEADLGVEGQILPKVTGNASAGYNSRTYDDTVAGLRNSYGTMSYALNLTWTPAERTAVSVGGTRSFAEAVFGTNRFYNTTTVNGSVMQKLGDKATATAIGSFEQDNYPESSTLSSKTAKRMDGITQAGLNLDYLVTDAFKLGASYLYRSRSSNFSSFDYNDSLTSVSFKLAF